MDKRFGRWTLALALLISLLAARQGLADGPASGDTTGTVTYCGPEFLLIRAAGDVPRRHSLKTSETTGADLLSAYRSVGLDDEVVVHWTEEGGRRIDSIRILRKAATRPVEGPSAATPGFAPTPTPTPTMGPITAAAPTTPTSAPTTNAASSDAANRSTTGETVNAQIDNLLALSARLMTLPISLLLTTVAAVGIVLLFFSGRLSRVGRPVAAARLRTAVYLGSALFAVFLVDRKISLLQADMAALKSKVNSDTLAAIATHASPASSVRPLLVDPTAVQTGLNAHFKDATIRPSTYDAATDIVQIYIGDPLVQAYLAVVDLSNPAVEIKLGTGLDQKTLTSDFAVANGCGLAINGEAGQSPAMNSGLGVWRGNMVYQGQIVSREAASSLRPFLGFDPANHASFTPASAADRTLPAYTPTLIWGRLDSIVNGVVQTADERFRQPRTAMGISQDGKRLYLLVVDGRQQRYSVGFSRAEVGYLLQAFGAYNAMLCDEGGSSCMYLKQFGGIVNSPSDGSERPTYTHFGIALRH
ncbi:MAG: multidrug transporter [Phycisphaerales bacterium]|nr:multidrug transporter [Phycisphaerales bacterium]